MANPYQSPEQPSPAPAVRNRRCLACPHCGEAAMSLFKKSRVGTIRVHRCRSCGGKVRVGWRSAGFSVLFGFATPLVIAGVLLFAPAAREIALELYRNSGNATIVAACVAIALAGGAVQTAALTLAAPLIKAQ